MLTCKTNCPAVTIGSVDLRAAKAEAGTSPRKAVMPYARVLVLGVALMLAATASQAQILYGSVVGNVSDPNGHAVPGARVEATNVGTRESKNTTTNDNGEYSFSHLQVGVYKLTITKTSFKTLVKED